MNSAIAITKYPGISLIMLKTEKNRVFLQI